MMQQPAAGVAPPPQMAPMSMDQQQQQPPPPPQYQAAPPPQYQAALPQQYQAAPPHPQQQWMMMPPQQPPPPPQMWAQQRPPTAMQPQPQLQSQPQPQPPPQQQQQYPKTQSTGGSDEIRSLWIGDLQYWMEENYVWGCFSQCEAISAKVIRNKQSGQTEGYGFIEFATRAAAERALQTYNGTLMPNSEQTFRLNWATLGAGERRTDDTPDYTIFVGDLASDVTDYLLTETFRPRYPSLKGAKVVTDRMTGRSKGYGFVRFGDESEQLRALHEMNGILCSTRAMRIGPAATKKPADGQQHSKTSYQNSQGNQGESDPSNTTIFVGGLESSVSEDNLRQVFGRFGELQHVKIPVGKRCGFVQFVNRSCAEQALSFLNGTQLGGQNIRLSWGRSPSNKQSQPEQTQWNGGGYYGGYPQGYEAYGYTAAPPPQDPNMYYAGYAAGYGSYPQPQE